MPFSSTLIPLRSRDSFFRDPYFSDCWEIMERQKREFEQKCASSSEESNNRSSLLSNNKFNSSLLDKRIGTNDDNIFQIAPSSKRRLRYYPASLMMMDSDYLTKKFSTGLGIHSDKENFKVSLDVQQFAPEELSVKTFENTIVIEGKHEEKEDPHGLISRHFQRKYTLPSDVKVDEVKCNFTSDGRLHISAPRHLPSITHKKESYDQKSDYLKSDNHKSDYTKDDSHKSDFFKGDRIFPSTISDNFRDEIQEAREEFEKSASSMFKDRADRRDDFREEIKRTQEEFDKNNLFSRDNSNDFRHSRLLRMFQPHFTAFPEFEPMPFWKRRNEKKSSLLEDFNKSSLLEGFDKKSSLFDEFMSGRLKSSLFETENSKESEEVKRENENFQVMIDVHEFKPEELSVKTYDYYIEIEAKHDAKKDPHGYITRHFKRKYTLPRDVKAEQVQCNLSSEGILLVTAPRSKGDENSKVPIPITLNNESSSLNSLSSSRHLGGQKTSEAKSYGEHVIPISNEETPKEKVFQNTSTVHQIFTEKKPLINSDDLIKTKRDERPHVNIETNKEKLNDCKMERIIPIEEEGGRVEFPESRPESSASSIPFDFSRGRSEEPISVASSTLPTNNLEQSGERIIKIQVS